MGYYLSLHSLNQVYTWQICELTVAYSLNTNIYIFFIIRGEAAAIAGALAFSCKCLFWSILCHWMWFLARSRWWRQLDKSVSHCRGCNAPLSSTSSSGQCYSESEETGAGCLSKKFCWRKDVAETGVNIDVASHLWRQLLRSKEVQIHAEFASLVPVTGK